MTDITELAQREKFEAWAEEGNALPWGYLKKRRTYDGFYSEHTYTCLWAAWKAAGAELVEALEKAQSAKRTLESLGYTDNGGELWKPPIGPKPNFCLMDSYRHRIEELENDEVRQHLANAEHQLHIAELAKNNLRASRKAQFRKRKAAEKRIAELVEVLENTHAENELVRGQLFIAGRALLNQQAKIAELEEAEQKLCAANVTLDARAELAELQLAEMESRTFTTAATDVLAERQRQITAEGWTPEHDDEYQHCEMAVAAACYIMADDDPRADVPELWPWPSEWWKPTDVRRDLVKAGALILAEIERLDRAAGTKEAE